MDEALALAGGQALALTPGPAPDQGVKLDEPFQVTALLSGGQPHDLLSLAGSAPVAQRVGRHVRHLERLGGVLEAALHFPQPSQARQARRRRVPAESPRALCATAIRLRRRVFPST